MVVSGSHKFSLTAFSVRKSSPKVYHGCPFWVGGRSWRIQIGTGYHESGFVSFYIMRDGSPWPVELVGTLIALDPTGGGADYRRTLRVHFGNSHGGFGTSTLLSLEDAELYCKDDTITFVGIVSLESAPLTSGDCNKLAKPRADLGQKLLAMLENNGGDVEFQVQGEQCAAHKQVLASRSSVFEALFEASSERTIEVKDIEPPVFQAMIKFAYTDAFHSDHDVAMAQKLLIAADRYKMERLKTASARLLSKKMDKHNVLRIFALASQCQVAWLKEECHSFLCVFAKDMVRTPEIMAFMESGSLVRVPWWEPVYSFLKSLKPKHESTR